MIVKKVLFWALCSGCLLEIKTELDEVFEMKADEEMDRMLDGVLVRKEYPKKYRHFGGDSTSPSTFFISTRGIPQAANNVLDREFELNMTLEEFNKRRREHRVKSLLEYEINPSPNFQDSEDDIEIQTRRFKKLNLAAHPESARREIFFPEENGTYIYGEKNKTIGVMQQFIYETHYMLPYMQVVRKKYLTDYRYQMGYCFALLRNLKKQQMVIHSTLKKYYDLIMTVYAHLQLYQKIVRLDVDLKDVIRLIYALDVKRKRLKTKHEGKTTPKD